MKPFIDMLMETWPGVLLVGGSIGGVVAWIATKAARKQTMVVQEQMIKAYEDALAAKDGLAKDLKEGSDARIAAIKENLVVMTKERDSYRETLHTVRNDLGVENTRLQVRVAELESRPNLEMLYKSEQDWHAAREVGYTKLSEAQTGLLDAQKAMVQLIEKLGEKIEKEVIAQQAQIAENLKLSQATASALEALVKRLTDDGVLQERIVAQT